MSGQCGSEGSKSVEDLALKVMQDQPRTFGNGCCHELIIEASQVAGPECRRGRETLEEVVHRRDLLVERIGQGGGLRQSMLSEIRPFLGGAPQQQRRGDSTCNRDNPDKSQRHLDAKPGCVAPRVEQLCGAHLARCLGSALKKEPIRQVITLVMDGGRTRTLRWAPSR